MSRQRVGWRMGRITVGVALFAFLFALAPIRALAITDWTVTLTPVGPTSVAQGLPFTFTATVTNNGPGATDTVVFLLSSPSAETWDFYQIRLTLGPGESQTSDPIPVTSSAMFAELGTYEVTPLVGGAPAGAVLPYEVTEPLTVVPLFADATSQAGVGASIGGRQCSSYTAGSAWGDVDGDGDLDLYLPIRTFPSRLFINDGTGHFTDEAQARGVDAMHGLGAVFVDYDNDGDKDLPVASDDGFHLYRNDGTGQFAEVTSQAGVSIPGAGPQGSAWADFDRDGDLDVYVTRYADCRSGRGLPDRLFRNNGNGTFTDVTSWVERNPLNPDDGSTLGAGFQAGWVDIDTDGDDDLYLANDLLAAAERANHLWSNDGPTPGKGWSFKDISKPSGAGYVISSMGLGIADYDRDLDFDLAISNVGPNVLARNNGNRTFTDVAKAARVDRPWDMAGMMSMTWGLDFEDLNNDGWEELYVLQGMMNDDPNMLMPHELFVNAGDGTFYDLSAPSGAMGPGTGRGIAFADYDRDGRMDMYVVNQVGSPVLYHNQTPLGSYHWLEVLLTGTASNRDGCGARLVLTLSNMDKILRGAFCGSTSLGSGHDPAVHFGLGADSQPLQLDIYWPSGIHQTIANPAVDQLIPVVEAP